jgi:hypothetical protein
MTNVAVCPALTSELLEKDWTCTHSWATAGFFLGFGEELRVGVGVGFGLDVLLGDGLGLEVGFLVDVVVGVGLGDVDDDLLGDGELLADLLGEADVLDVVLALADTEPLRAGTVLSVSDAMTAESLGTDAQAALTIGWFT